MKKINKTKKSRFNLHWYFVITIWIAMIVISIASAGIAAVMRNVFFVSINIAGSVYEVILSIVLGGIMAVFFSKKLLAPIIQLSESMGKVAEGDFTIRLETKSMIKEIKDLYANFNVMVTELNATEVLQNDFVSNVSHEFKTPISAIEGYAMLLQGDAEVTGEQEEYTEKILYNTKRLSSLVRNILLLSKVDNHIIPSKSEKYCLDEQIRQAIVALETKWMEKNLEFDVEMEQIYFVGNEALLYHVWSNLIDNAIKFNIEEGCIKIRLISSEQKILFTIQDKGPGISENEKKRIFDKFYQADSSHKDEGNGLGLALVKQIVNLHKGTIAVENAADGGCKFTIILPILNKC